MTIQEKMQTNQRRYRQRVEQIRADEDLNEHARRRHLKEAHQEARTKHGELFEAQRQQITERLEKKRKAVLGPPHISGADKASLAISYRDALDRVSSITESKVLTEKLQRAENTGDDVLARAILARGYELRDESVVGSYLEKYPNDLERWNRFMDAAQEYNTLDEQNRMFGDLGPEKPRELGG